MKNLFGVFSLLILSSIASAENTYVVESRLYVDNNLIGSPVITAEAGKTSKVLVSGLYEYDVVITEQEKEIISVSANIEIDGKKYEPSLSTTLGNEGSLEIGELKWSLKVKKTGS